MRVPWIICTSGILFFVQIASSTLVAWDSACGTTKGCFPNCPNGCDYLVTWSISGSDVVFSMSFAESGSGYYLAIGFSDDRRMGEDSVVGCLVPNSAVESWYNEGTDSDPLSPATTGLSSTSASQANGVITCTFNRALTNADSKYFDLNNDYIIMLLIGEAEEDEGSYKMGEHHMIPWMSKEKVDFQSTNIYELYKMNSPAVKLHGIMMVFAWMLCCTVGIVIARHNKDMVPGKTLFGTKYWFQLHRGSMIGVMLFAVIGFIPIFVEIMGYSQLTPPSNIKATAAHPILGIIVTVLMFANPIMALFRPGGDHKLRPLFNWAHLGVGVVAMVLAVVCLMTGLVMERSMLSTEALIIGLLWLAAVIVMAVVMEIFKWRNYFASKKVAGEKPDDGQMAIEEKKEPAPKMDLQFILLMVFVGLIGAFTIATVVMIGNS